MDSCRKVLRTAGFAALMAVMVVSCAKVGAPPGGPEDKTGPTVVDHEPKSDAVEVARHMVARLLFSEPVNRRSVEAALFLSPDPLQRLRYHWRGNTLELIYLDPLETDHTYVISVGSQARDLHGNPMGSSYTIAFSTGTLIDRGRIEGWVDEEDNPQAVSLWAFRLLGEDSLVDPARRAADYRLQAGKDGSFHFNYIKIGRYRVFAVVDRNHDGFWNPPAERIGIPPWDVTVSDSTVPWLSFRLAEQDTESVKLRSVREMNAQWLQARTDRGVDSLTAFFMMQARDTALSSAAYPDTSGKDLWNLFPQRELDKGLWTINATGTDVFGQAWQDQDTFSVRARADTVRPRLWRTFPRARDKCTQVPRLAIVQFDEPVKTDSLQNLFMVIEADTDTIACRTQQVDPLTFNVEAVPAFAEGMRYRVQMNSYLVQDMSGNHPADSTFAFSFTALPADSLGSVIGKINGPSGSYQLSLWSVHDHRLTIETDVNAPGGFRMERIPVGKYILQVARDLNRDGKFTYGGLRPLEFAEPFRFSNDTVSVRARWEYETQVTWEDAP
jgi:hypothetical protein